MSEIICPSCGASNPAGSAFCTHCGARLGQASQPQYTPQQPTQPQYTPQQPTQPQYTPPPPQYPPQYAAPQAPGYGPVTRPPRPTGVTILAVLEVIGAISTIGAGFLVGAITGFVGAGFTALFVVIGLVELFLAWGLYTGKGWARLVALIFAVIGLIGIPIGTIISIIILYYLTRPNVKAYFAAH